MKEKHIYKFETNGYTTFVLAHSEKQALEEMIENSYMEEDDEYAVTEIPQEEWPNHSVLNEEFDWDALDFQDVTRTFEELANTEQCPSLLSTNLEQ